MRGEDLTTLREECVCGSMFEHIGHGPVGMIRLDEWRSKHLCPDRNTKTLAGISQIAQTECEQRLSAVLAIHVPSTDHGDGYNPYCVGCWDAGGQDGAPSWPCPTALAAGVS